MDFMDSIKSTLGLDDGGGGGSSSSTDSGGGGVLTQTWNAVSDGASQMWDAASSTASSAVSAVGDGASQAWNAVTDTASSAASAVGSGASSLMSTVSDDASAAWNAVSDGAVSVKDAIVHGDSNWTKDTELNQQAFERQQEEQKARDANPAIQKFRQEQMEKGGHEVGAKDAGFDSAQHMQDYSKASSDFNAAWDKLNKIQDSDEREKMRQQMNMPKSMDDYMRQQHIPPRGKPAY